MTAPRYKQTKWSGLDNYECQLCPYATLDYGLMVAHVRETHPTPAELGGQAPHPLASVPFASDEAAELALEAGLGPADFEAHHPTGKSGFTLHDVRRIAASRLRGASPEGTTQATTEEN